VSAVENRLAYNSSSLIVIFFNKVLATAVLLPFGFSLSFASANCGRLLAGCQLESFSIHQLVKNLDLTLLCYLIQ
jgi:hypothetical protein